MRRGLRRRKRRKEFQEDIRRSGRGFQEGNGSTGSNKGELAPCGGGCAKNPDKIGQRARKLGVRESARQPFCEERIEKKNGDIRIMCAIFCNARAPSLIYSKTKLAYFFVEVLVHTGM